MSERLTIRKFLLSSFEVQHDAWYDWFCSDRALVAKTKSLVAKLRQIALSPKINLDTNYVFFKNNCPMVGSLYDDFRICDIESGDVIYTIVPSSGHDSKKGEACVYGRENGFETPLVNGTWDDVVAYFNAV